MQCGRTPKTPAHPLAFLLADTGAPHSPTASPPDTALPGKNELLRDSSPKHGLRLPTPEKPARCRYPCQVGLAPASTNLVEAAQGPGALTPLPAAGGWRPWGHLCHLLTAKKPLGSPKLKSPRLSSSCWGRTRAAEAPVPAQGRMNPGINQAQEKNPAPLEHTLQLKILFLAYLPPGFGGGSSFGGCKAQAPQFSSCRKITRWSILGELGQVFGSGTWQLRGISCRALTQDCSPR